MRALNSAKKNRGISLVEVLAALAVFMIGILWVVRMFPGGFATVKHSENVTLAGRLAQSELERWHVRASNLPSGILPWGYDGTTFSVLPDVDPEAISDLVQPGGRYYSDVNRFRRVRAEATRIPVPASSGCGYGSVYVLGFSPIEWSVENDVTVYSGALRRRGLPRDLSSLRIRSSGEYAIDYDDRDGNSDAAVFYVQPMNRPRSYVITYSYWSAPSGVGRPRLISVVSQQIDVPAGNPSDAFQAVPIPDPNNPGALLKDAPGFEGIDRRSESLHRGFINLTLTGGDWSASDPYEFKIINTAVGILLFNPAGYGWEEVTARGKEPLVAYIDYTVLDWHIISEERRVSDIVTKPSDGDVKLSLRFIKRAGVTEERDGTTYGGLAPAFGLPQSVLAVDLETGAVYGDDSGAFLVNYKDGILRFPPEYAGRTFRIYYQADGDWAVQLYKAYDVYQSSANQPPSEQEYYLSNDGVVYFRRCYAGKTVSMDVKYVAMGGSGEEEFVVRGLTFRIPEQYVSVGSARVCGVNVLEALANLNPPGFRVDDVSNVRGVSVGARVIWREGGRGFRLGRWKQQRIETYLVRSEA